jgi:hypothetical protein
MGRLSSRRSDRSSSKRGFPLATTRSGYRPGHVDRCSVSRFQRRRPEICAKRRRRWTSSRQSRSAALRTPAIIEQLFRCIHVLRPPCPSGERHRPVSIAARRSSRNFEFASDSTAFGSSTRAWFPARHQNLERTSNGVDRLTHLLLYPRASDRQIAAEIASTLQPASAARGEMPGQRASRPSV